MDKIKLVRAASERPSQDNKDVSPRDVSLTQSAEQSLTRKSAFGARMSAPQKKSSLADIFFMSSPLHGHAKRGDVAEIVKMVSVRKGALKEDEFLDWLNSHVNKNEQTALHVAIQHGHTEAALKLAELGSSLSLRDINGRTPLLYAARYGRIDLLRFFWDKIERPQEESDTQGDSALHLAAIHGHLEAIRFVLVDKGGNVNQANKFGETALHKAARTDNLALVNLLLELGADVNAMGQHGKPRHVAGSEAVAQRLRSTTPSQRVVDVDKLLQSESADDDDSSDDVQFMNPGVRKIIEGGVVHGTSPAESAELVHFKLRRAMEKSGSGMLRGVASVSDEQLFNQHEVIRKQSLASGGLSPPKDDSFGRPVDDKSELAAPSDASGVQIEMTLASGMTPKPGHLTYLFEPYRGIFGRPHYNYVCHSFNTQSGPQTVIATVLAGAEGNAHPGLLRWSAGYSAFSLPVDDIKAEEKDLAESIRLVLERSLLGAEDLAALANNVVSPSTLRKPITTPKTKRLSIMIKHVAQTWRLHDEQPLKTELLALELKLGLPRQISIGVILLQPGQNEAAGAANNVLSKAAEAFMSSIAAPSDSLGSSSYTGGLSSKESTKFYYCGWRGLEIVFHVAPLLTDAQKRQFIGNDKVLIYFLDNWRPGSKLDPCFRGNVNSYAICVAPVAANFYKFSAFHRLGMNDSKPAFGEDPVELNVASKEVLFHKLVNAHVDSYNLLYSQRMERAWKEEVTALADRYSTDKKKGAKKSPKKK